MTRLEAAQKGERFFTAKPCKRDGDTRRYTAGGQCVTCSKRRSAQAQQAIAALIAGAKTI